jgi:drug/metabolite transporter (DMT)-like permease
MRFVRLRRESWGFAIGSLLFMLGAVPPYQQAVGAVATNITFFAGSLFFTAAGFIQLSLSGKRPPSRKTNSPDTFDWWSAAVQFVGTLFFNLSTASAWIVAANADSQLSGGWRPDAVGSIAFLVSSVLAVISTTARDKLWDPQARTWRCTWLNMSGSVLFGLSAVGAYTIPATSDPVSIFWANFGTFTGAACFFAAAVLGRPGAQQGAAVRTAG